MNKKYQNTTSKFQKWNAVILIFLILIFIYFPGHEACAGETREDFESAIVFPLPREIRETLVGCSWRPDCPVHHRDLALVRLSHWDFTGEISMGELIVHRKLAGEVVDVFREIYLAGFPIFRMELIDQFGGNDDASMAANNSSAFNCRGITGNPRAFSRHSYGTAIDINPVQNPYRKGKRVLPVSGAEYLDRKRAEKGMILPGGPVHRAFTKRGWTWGGDWWLLKDYQHFEKPD